VRKWLLIAASLAVASPAAADNNPTLARHFAPPLGHCWTAEFPCGIVADSAKGWEG